jgi:hypothetical protein
MLHNQNAISAVGILVVLQLQTKTHPKGAVVLLLVATKQIRATALLLFAIRKSKTKGAIAPLYSLLCVLFSLPVDDSLGLA